MITTACPYMTLVEASLSPFEAGLLRDRRGADADMASAEQAIAEARRALAAAKRRRIEADRALQSTPGGAMHRRATQLDVNLHSHRAGRSMVCADALDEALCALTAGG